MGANLCSFRKPSPKQLQNKKNPTERPIKQCYFKTEKRRLGFSPQEKRIAKTRELTLEEWLLASPGMKQDCINAGELHVFKQSSRVYPSNGTKGGMANALSGTKDSFCLERVVKVVDDDGGKEDMMICSSVSRSQSGKKKKKVSFRMPEEADIFIFYSPKEALCL